MSADDNKELVTMARGAGTAFVGSAAGRFFWFAAQVVIARWLGATTFGLFVLALVAIRLAETVARFGLHTGAMYFVSIHKEDAGRAKGTLVASTLISFFNGAVVAAVVFALGDVIATGLFKEPAVGPVIRRLSLAIPFMATATVLATASQGYQTTRHKVMVLDIVQPVVNGILVVLLLCVRQDVESVVYAYVISFAAAAGVGLWLVSTRCCPGLLGSGVRGHYELKPLLSYSAPLLLAGVLVIMLMWTDVLMLGILGTAESVGIYRAASQIPIFLSLILNASNAIYGPLAASYHHKGQIEQMRRMFKTSARWVFALALPPALILMLSPKGVMAIFGREFTDTGAKVLAILALSQLVCCSAGGVGYTLIVTGRQKIEMVNSFILVCVNIVLNYIMIRPWGPVGAAIATCCSFILIRVVRLAEVYILYRVQPYTSEFAKIALAGVVAAAPAVVLRLGGWQVSEMLVLAINCVSIAAVSAMYFALGRMSEDDKMIIGLFMKKLKPA